MCLQIHPNWFVFDSAGAHETETETSDYIGWRLNVFFATWPGGPRGLRCWPCNCRVTGLSPAGLFVACHSQSLFISFCLVCQLSTVSSLVIKQKKFSPNTVLKKKNLKKMKTVSASEIRWELQRTLGFCESADNNKTLFRHRLTSFTEPYYYYYYIINDNNNSTISKYAIIYW